MKFSKETPPIWDRLEKTFGVKWGGNLCVTYGDTVHHSVPLNAHVIVHESVHSRRQKDPADWWEHYFRDSKFRFWEELLAFRAQYQFLEKTTRDRNELARCLLLLASDLSSMYQLPISQQEAVKLIKMK